MTCDDGYNIFSIICRVCGRVNNIPIYGPKPELGKEPHKGILHRSLNTHTGEIRFLGFGRWVPPNNDDKLIGERDGSIAIVGDLCDPNADDLMIIIGCNTAGGFFYPTIAVDDKMIYRIGISRRVLYKSKINKDVKNLVTRVLSET